MSSPVRPADIIARIEAAERRGDQAQAITLAVDALKGGDRSPLVLSLVAEALEAQGRRSEALGLLQRVIAARPGDAQARFRLGRLLFALDRRETARAAFEGGLAIDPDDYRGLVDAGTVCLRLADLAAAAGYFQRASDLSPEAAEPLSALAVTAGLAGDAAQARTMATRALAFDPSLISARIALARAEMAEGGPGLAVSELSALLIRTDLTDPQRVDAHDLRAEGLDALDRSTEAFADYTARNEALRRVHAPAFATASESHFARAARLAAWFEAGPMDPWRRSPDPDAVGARAAGRHVFLVGFPRSGTTLLEKVLASHPGIVTLEEMDVLGAVSGALLATDDGLGRLASLTTTQAQPIRQAYWRDVQAALGEPIGGRIFVDKLPLHTPALPLIAKVFPDARILFAVRDPRDVVFSCFRRRFRVNAAMFEFLGLENAARYYDAVMRLAAIYRECLPLAFHEVRHEALVADFEGEVRHVLAFIGAPWDPAVHDFPALARESNKTPSAPQVARGLNTDGIAQWRRYRTELAPVAPILAPWVERFGYDEG